MRTACLFLFALLSCTPARVAGQGRPETIQGRVLTDSGQAVRGAEVIVTRSPDRAERSTTTDTTGRFAVTFPDGTGDYLVHVAAPGWRGFRQRVTRSGSDSVLVVNAKLAPQPVAVAGVTAKGRRSRPSPGGAIGPETGASEAPVEGMLGALSPEQMGDLAAMAATIPGVIAGQGGLSALGMDAGQMNTTLNGMAFAGADIPRDARTTTRFATSTYDPARGGFSAGQISVELSPGSTFSSRSAHAVLDAPPLQYSDPVSDRLGGKFTNLQLSSGSQGPLSRKFTYNVAAQGSRRVADALSVTDAGSDVLRLSGVAADSALRFVQLLTRAGIPTITGVIPSSRIDDNLSVIGRLDHTPRADRTWGVTAYGKLSRNGATALVPTATATHGGTLSSGIGSLQGSYSFYHRKNTLNETKSAVTFTSTRVQPYLLVPGGNVLVSSSFEDGGGGLSSLSFGGQGGIDSDNRAWTWETTNTTQWFNRANHHRVKVYVQSRLDAKSQASAGDRLGTFGYASLADLAANHPSSFTRVMQSPTARGGEWSGVLAVGDSWKRSPSLQILYGARVETNRFLSPPAYNPEVRSAFGVETDHAPNSVSVSPRLGFSWLTRGPQSNRSGFMGSSLGTRSFGPTGVLRGGVGEFRNLLPPALLSQAELANGLPGALRRIQCIGPAVPTPDWESYLQGPDGIPAACAGGVAPGFSDAAPAVQLFGSSYAAPRSWRGNLVWSSQWRKLSYSLEGIYSLNLNQSGIFDLNFSDAPRFVLAAEGNRPVYVSPASIVAATGAVSPVDARRATAFGHVLSHGSDLRSDTRQLTVTASPDLPFGRYFLSLAYTLSDTRAQFRGFDGRTFGSPTAVEWAPGSLDARHQILVQAGLAVRWLNVSLIGRLSSGTPFTPLVGGDVNGDGLVNDRAFVFDPGNTADPALAAGMQTLLSTAPRWARSCLDQQLGGPAARNSCRGPWTQSLNLRLGSNQRPFRAGRLNISANLSNPLGGLDQLLHGGEGLQGWGTSALPDPVLVRVRGFDPAAQRFR